MNRTEGLHFLEHVGALQVARRESFAAGVVVGAALTAVVITLLVIFR